MNILIFTQKVDINDDVLGAFHGWILAFAREFDLVNVVCLQKGEYSLPNNVKVHSLGKEEWPSKLKYLYRFYKYIWNFRAEYDVVLVHMNPEYAILGGIFWHLMRKKTAMWYSHKKGNFLRRLALFMVCRVFSVSNNSFVNYKNKKFRALGHGVDTDSFYCPKQKTKEHLIKKFITVGRVAPLKACEILIQAAQKLAYELNEKKFTVEFIGGPGANDKEYFASLQAMVKEFNLEKHINFLGPISNNKILPYLCAADFFVSMQKTGDVGKSTIEAMSAEVPALICATGPGAYFFDMAQDLIFDGSAQDLARKMQRSLRLSAEKRADYGKKSRDIILQHYNLQELIHKIYLDFAGGLPTNKT